MLTAVIWDTDNSGKQVEVCRLRTEDGRVRPSSLNLSGLFVLNRPLYNGRGRKLTKQDGDEFLRLMPAAYSGTRTRVELIEDVGVSAKMVGGRLQIEIDLKGDLPGHEFHGNQWDGGGVPEQQMSQRTKSEIAKASATRVDAEIQRYCEEGEREGGGEGPWWVFVEGQRAG